MSTLKEPKVSIVMPVLNEEKYIDKCIESVLKQDYPKDDLEFILVDGYSEDNTEQIIRSYMKKYDFIRLCKNINKTVQYALNIGIKASRGEYIVRMDAHAEYADDYVSKCMEYLEKTDAVNVGGPTVARGKNPIQKVVAAAYHSKFALGGGKIHMEDFEGYADTVFPGAFKKDYLFKIGLYDERLPRNEDDDLNFRINETGGKVYVTPKIRCIYYPRDNYTSLFKQHYEYGLWKVAVIKKHKRPARITHLVPMLFVLFILMFSILSFVSKLALYTFLSVLSLYIVLDAYFSFSSKYISSFLDKLRLMYVHFILHISYGIGFWVGIFKFMNVKW